MTTLRAIFKVLMKLSGGQNCKTIVLQTVFLLGLYSGGFSTVAFPPSTPVFAAAVKGLRPCMTGQDAVS